MLIVVMKEVEVKEIGFNVHIILLYSYSSNTYMLIITCISRTLCSLLCYYFSGVGNVVRIYVVVVAVIVIKAVVVIVVIVVIKL